MGLFSKNSFLYEKIFPKLIYVVIKFVFSTIKMRIYNDTEVRSYIDKGMPVIFTFWHNRLAYAPFGYMYVFKKRGLVAMVSRSKDGRLMGEVVKFFGVIPVYGSTSKGGTEVLREVIKYVKEDKRSCAITPDGPRGPIYEVQHGVISVAQATGAPIIPLTYDVKRKLILNTWDRFYVPMPFTRGVLYFGEPMYIPLDISDDQKINYQNKLQDCLNKICGKVGELVKII